VLILALMADQLGLEEIFSQMNRPSC